MIIKNLDLFTPVVAADKLHPNFLATISPYATGVRKVLNNWVKGFVDRDGKFVKEFQTTYKSCFWELYLFAIIKEIKADVDFSFSSPDFICNNGIVIEATTANHSRDDVPEWEKTISRITEGNLLTFLLILQFVCRML